MVLTAVALLAGSSLAAQSARVSGLVVGGEPVAGLRGFSVALVQGDLKAGTPIGESVPAAATKALADLKDFLPYKSYRLLDTQWTMGAGRMTGRLHGPEAKEYDLELQARRGPDDTPVTVSRFLLREVGVKAPGDLAGRFFERGGISQSQTPVRSKTLVGSAFALTHTVIDTSFNMDIGETVVVGTSRLQGDTALIVLLTAVPRADRLSRGR